MTHSISIANAKNTLPRLVHKVEDGATVTLTRRGKPVAILISLSELEHLRGDRRRFDKAYRELLDRFDLGEMAIDPEEVFVRPAVPSGGKSVIWK